VLSGHLTQFEQEAMDEEEKRRGWFGGGGVSEEETKNLLVLSLCPLVLLVVGRRQGETLASKRNYVAGGECWE
jgi:hypothetical protein